ncbi:hypothetical protein BS47DRAFT_1355506, partial [Hydnum rufescens UP504]
MSLSLEIPNRIVNSFRHSTIYNYCIGWGHFIPERDILLAVLPCFQVFGGVVSSLAPLSIGVPLIILPRFQPAAFLATIQKHNIA